MDITTSIIIFFLIFSRISGIFILTPLFGSNNIPKTLKIGFSVFLTLIALPLVKLPAQSISNIYILLYFIISEFFIGLIFGFVSLLVLNSIYVAGVIVDRNIGFSIVNVLSPQDESEMPITANLYYTMAIMVFLITNSHHILIKAILHSFKTVPLGFNASNLLFLNKVIDILQTSFILGFKIASPIIITIFITNILLGILSRSIPQMNVFIVGMPLKILVGLVTMFIILPLYFGIFSNIFSMMFEYIKNFINNVPKG
ncbi:MAG: flagellar biosynthesis protein FliR [Candidatus Petromonas sp.]|jgi:flagellar biosynthetic protein FliR|nr:flagellar biosynthesis protein FliR [Candidatus Petromonas sp.]